MDKVVVITGASSGIGEKLAELCITRGAYVVLGARSVDKLAALAARLGHRAHAVPMDVTRRADNARLRDEALGRFNRIDVWVANAGRGITRPVSELTDDDLDQMMAVNVKSLVYGIQSVLPHFKTHQRGHIVAVSSMLGRIPMFAPRSAYSASKAAMTSLMTSLRLELMQDFPDIHASTIFPGVVATDFGKHALHGGPDSHTLPNAQSVDEVVSVIAQVIEKPVAEAYTRSEMREFASRYFSAPDVAQIEAKFVTRP
jgi:NADP-dependent 3-hydroxy acid dehydrogenase YdfG